MYRLLAVLLAMLLALPAYADEAAGLPITLDPLTPAPEENFIGERKRPVWQESPDWSIDLQGFPIALWKPSAHPILATILYCYFYGVLSIPL